MNSDNAALKHVPRGRPEILRSLSKQSVTASDDYRSLSDYGSTNSEEPPTGVRWATPPSQARSPDNVIQDNAVPPASERNSPGRPSQRAGPSAPAVAVTTGDAPQPSLGSARPASQTRSRKAGTEVGSSPPTPGVDDTPYIRYAIEQITRDELDRDRSRRPTSGSSASTYPVDRIVPVDQRVPQPPPAEGDPQRDAAEKRGQDKSPQLWIPVDTFEPSALLPQLTFRPAILRLPSLALLALLSLLMTAAVAFCAAWSRRRDGLWDYNGADGGRYFLFKFFPQILASILVFYILSVATAIMRVIPFVCLTSKNLRSRSQALLQPLRPRSFVTPQLSYFRLGQPLLAISMFVFWLAALFSIPLQSCLFHVRFVALGGGPPRWRWVAVEGVAWTLVVIYLLLTMATLITAGFFFRRHTGLKWDPVSLADIIVMLERSNSLDSYERSETFGLQRDFRERLAPTTNRLGYWRLADAPGGVFYAIGEEGAPTRRYSLQQGRIQRQPADSGAEKSAALADGDLEAQQLEKGEGRQHDGRLLARMRSPMVRYRFVAWFLRDSSVVAWISAALALLIAFLVVSFLHRAVQRGFRPHLNAGPNSAGFSSAAFLYSFLPCMIGVLLFLLWRSIDMEFRALQPFASMTTAEGALAEHSLLLDYPSCFLGEVTVRAAAARHWKVAYLSAISLLSVTLPILGGGVFWPIFFPDAAEVRMVARMPAFIALTVFFAIYCLSFLVVWPRRKRYLPHDSRSLAELTSFVYRSPLLREPAFQAPRSKTDLVTRLLSARSAKGEERARYGVGVYRGIDGEEHLGISRIG